MENRIRELNASTTVARQTPKRDFGEMLARGVSTSLRYGAALMSGPGALPVVSAAVARGLEVGQTAAISTTVPGAMASPPNGCGTRAYGLDPAPKPTAATIDAQAFDQQLTSDRLDGLMFLDLQRRLQNESRQFNAVSNVMKVRHDSAKAAINNVR
jgi:hypothetical protein